MSITERMPFSIILGFLIATGCATLTGPTVPTIPTSRYPLEIEKVFHSPFGETWDSALEVMTSKGTIINKDKSSGLIVYTIFDKKSKKKVYGNVYLKSHPDKNDTVVYFTQSGISEGEAQARHRKSKKGFIWYFTPGLKSHYYLEGIGRDFFQKLERSLGKIK